ncbi:uncharacterized MFS-type transporter C09D4.1-like isoform X2 [Anthonomus grandis grandis]|nr:uncharacterized MFS-type transporter C09D4.1-like isoform X2 [Anthonomus grandis grandis]
MNESPTDIPEIKLFKDRWIILTIFVLVAIINSMQLLQFSIIATTVSEFYQVEDLLVDLTTLVFYMAYIVFFIPVSFFIEIYNLKVTVITGTGLTLAGNIMKVFSAKPDRFWLILLAQVLIAIGQVQIYSLPSNLATVWFGSEEVSTACAIAVLGMQLGAALGCVISPFAISTEQMDKNENNFFQMYLSEAIITGVIFILVLIFFRSKPAVAPSQSQLNLISLEDSGSFKTYKNHMIEIFKNKNFWWIVLSLGLANGVWNCFGVVMNKMYLNFFPNGQNDIGVIGLLSIIFGGCIGSLAFGVLLDKTHHFKRISFAALAFSAAMYIPVTVSIVLQSRIPTFIIMPLFGFFIAPVFIIGLEYLVEVTYPIPEGCSSSVFNAAYYILALIITVCAELAFDSIGYVWTNVIFFILLVISSVFILLVNSDLKRRDANLRHSEVSSERNNESESS